MPKNGYCCQTTDYYTDHVFLMIDRKSAIITQHSAGRLPDGEAYCKHSPRSSAGDAAQEDSGTGMEHRGEATLV